MTDQLRKLEDENTALHAEADRLRLENEQLQQERDALAVANVRLLKIAELSRRIAPKLRKIVPSEYGYSCPWCNNLKEAHNAGCPWIEFLGEMGV